MIDSKTPVITRREVQRENLIAQIKSVAQRQMAEQGTAGLSLRQVAQELGMTAAALYRYFPSRDDLITALLVDSFNALAQTLAEADASQPRDQYAARFKVQTYAYRNWALANPVQFQLSYGDPIPGYHAPREITVPAAARVFIPMVMAINDALVAGVLTATPQMMSAQLETNLREMLSDYPLPVTPLAMYLAVAAWTRGHGMITLEMHGHTPPIVKDPTAFYEWEVEALIKWIGF